MPHLPPAHPLPLPPPSTPSSVLAADLGVDAAGFDKAMEEAREKSRSAGKRTAGVGLKFEAEATGWLQAKSTPLTNDAPKYRSLDVNATVLAILTPAGGLARQPPPPPL